MIEKEYFQRVSEAMHANCFRRFAQPVISTDDFGFHMPVSEARVTSMFFHAPGRNAIIILSYHEKNLNGTPDGCWAMDVHLEFAHKEYMEKFSFLGNGVRSMKRPISFAGFKWSFSDINAGRVFFVLREKQPQPGFPELPQLLAVRIYEGVWHAMNYLKESPFVNLQVSAWPPGHVFNGCERLFWKRFRDSAEELNPLGYLEEVLKAPWGSEGL